MKKTMNKKLMQLRAVENYRKHEFLLPLSTTSVDKNLVQLGLGKLGRNTDQNKGLAYFVAPIDEKKRIYKPYTLFATHPAN